MRFMLTMCWALAIAVSTMAAPVEVEGLDGALFWTWIEAEDGAGNGVSTGKSAGCSGAYPNMLQLQGNAEAAFEACLPSAGEETLYLYVRGAAAKETEVSVYWDGQDTPAATFALPVQTSPWHPASVADAIPLAPPPEGVSRIRVAVSAPEAQRVYLDGILITTGEVDFPEGLRNSRPMGVRAAPTASEPQRYVFSAPCEVSANASGLTDSTVRLAGKSLDRPVLLDRPGDYALAATGTLASGQRVALGALFRMTPGPYTEPEIDVVSGRGVSKRVWGKLDVDEPYPAWRERYWFDRWQVQFPKAKPFPGAYVHLFVKNDTDKPLEVSEVLVEGVPLSRALHLIERSGYPAANVRLAERWGLITTAQLGTLLWAGEPKWYKVTPFAAAAPGQELGVTIRLHHVPAGDSVNVTVVTSDGCAYPVDLAPHNERAVIRHIAFDEDDAGMHVWVRAVGDAGRPEHVFLDGERVEIPDARSFAGYHLLRVALPEPLERGSYHTLRVSGRDGAEDMAQFRAWDSHFSIGMYGWPMAGGDTWPERFRFMFESMRKAHVDTSLTMFGGGSSTFRVSLEGLDMAQEQGISLCVVSRGEECPEHVAFRYWMLMDEPDAHDFAIRELEFPMDRLGSLAMYCIDDMRRQVLEAGHMPVMLQINSTFKPMNLATYARLADIPMRDPYYYAQGCFFDPFYTFAQIDSIRRAAEPLPVNATLYAAKPKADVRVPNADEIRIAVYGAVAGGAKQLSYWWWWYVQHEPAYMEALRVLHGEVLHVKDILTHGMPLDIVESNQNSDPANGDLLARAIAGPGGMAVVVMNRRLNPNEDGFAYEPLKDVSISVPVPDWLGDADVSLITADGSFGVAHSMEDGRLTVTLDTLDLTALIAVRPAGEAGAGKGVAR